MTSDATVGRRAEALRESDTLFRTMADTAPVMIWMSDTEKRGTFFNKGWLDFTGRALAEELGEGWTQSVHPEDLDRCLAACGGAFRARRPFSIDYRMRRGDGQYRWVLDNGVPRHGADGAFLGYIGSCIDITERREAELDSARQRNELARLSRVAILGELSGALAHELNQPLAAILSNAQAAQRLLAREPADLEEVRSILADVVDEDLRARDVINRLRLLMEKGEVRQQAIDLNEAVLDVLRLVNGDLLLQGIKAHTDLAPALPAVSGDRVQVQQVLLNLILNGCYAMNNGHGARAQARAAHGGLGRGRRAGHRLRPGRRHRSRGPGPHLRALLHHAHRGDGPGSGRLPVDHRRPRRKAVGHEQRRRRRELPVRAAPEDVAPRLSVWPPSISPPWDLGPMAPRYPIVLNRPML